MNKQETENQEKNIDKSVFTRVSCRSDDLSRSINKFSRTICFFHKMYPNVAWCFSRTSKQVQPLND